MSSSGTILATTPLLPCRPAILSPTESLRLRGDIDLYLLDDAGIDIIPALDSAKIFVLLAIQILEAVLVLSR